jgi:undecaprenyl-diphosphatase
VPVLQAVILGFVQGLTEFIPISSSGHLVLVPEAMGWDAPGLTFDVLLHVASLVALLIYFSGDLLDIARGFLAKDPYARRMVAFLAVGTIPAAVAGYFLADYFERSFEDAKSSALQLIITAAILIAAEQALTWHTKRTARTGAHLRTMREMNLVDAGAIGIAQAISILPGISRSGSTIASGLALGLTRDDSARFAFLLAIPALLGAAIFKIPDFGDGGLGLGAGIGGFVASLVSSYAAISILIRYLKTRTLYPFAVYCVVAGIFFYLVV